MRSVLTFGLILIAFTLPGQAQEQKDAEQQTEPQLFDQTEPQAPSEVQTQRDAEPFQEVWKPRFAIVLHTAPGGVSRTVQKTVRQPITEMRYEKRVDDSGKAVMIPRKLTRYVERPISVTEPGTATLYCDALTVAVAGADEVPEFRFESKGRLTIHIANTVVDAASGILSEGQLELIDATVHQGITKFTSAKMSVSLPVHGILTQTFNQPVPQSSLAAPGVLVNPSSEPYGDDGEFTNGEFFDREDDTFGESSPPEDFSPTTSSQSRSSSRQTDGFIRGGKPLTPQPDRAFDE